MEPSLYARKELANERNVHVSEDGSAEENIALHKAVMDKLAENGGPSPTHCGTRALLPSCDHRAAQGSYC